MAALLLLLKLTDSFCRTLTAIDSPVKSFVKSKKESYKIECANS